jgi:hypothetical protein
MAANQPKMEEAFQQVNPKFAKALSKLEPSLKELLAFPPIQQINLPATLPKAGIYLFTEAGKHLYVGRSNDLRDRIQTHVRRSSKTNQAAFAYRLAREKAGIVKVSYKKLTPEEDWSLIEPFLSAFPASKERIRKMDLRVVSESEPMNQMLLEVYVAIALGTPYNDFDNH